MTTQEWFYRQYIFNFAVPVILERFPSVKLMFFIVHYGFQKLPRALLANCFSKRTAHSLLELGCMCYKKNPWVAAWLFINNRSSLVFLWAIEGMVSFWKLFSSENRIYKRAILVVMPSRVSTLPDEACRSIIHPGKRNP